MTAVSTINLCYAHSNVLPTRGLIDLENQSHTLIELKEFPNFVLLGVVGGLLGALLTKINLVCESLRVRYISRRRLPAAMDVFACTLATVMLSFILPFLFACKESDDTCAVQPDRCLRIMCGPQAYSQLGTLFFTLPEETIRILFDRNVGTSASIHNSELGLFAIVYSLMSLVTYGSATVGGLFIPSIIIGGSVGRIVGSLLAVWTSNPNINFGIYATLLVFVLTHSQLG